MKMKRFRIKEDWSKKPEIERAKCMVDVIVKYFGKWRTNYLVKGLLNMLLDEESDGIRFTIRVKKLKNGKVIVICNDAYTIVFEEVEEVKGLLGRLLRDEVRIWEDENGKEHIVKGRNSK